MILSDNADAFEAEVAKHDNIASEALAANIDALRGAADSEYDVVISEIDADAAVLAHLNRVLKEDGLLVSRHPSLGDVEANTTMMQILGKYTKVIMPYNLGNGETALFASKEYHPTADIILQRSDMLDGLEFYNCDVHPAAFAMGNNVRKAYLGVIKN